ncbi:hypothetical protein Y1Q_0006473 [Alligator mississippiensis]|uniref:Uncharacterized protein n=1 Tax=Alligator mississippiensis TaxID=8496 RepID=A0A151MVC4_ALLMI|nr:hypothetical protein Y1Q_0006473 [Alligator mississippiensis]
MPKSTLMANRQIESRPKRDEEDDHEERLDAEEGSGKSIEVEEWLEKEQPSAEEVIDGEEQQDLQEAIGNNEYQEEADESNDQETVKVLGEMSDDAVENMVKRTRFLSAARIELCDALGD